MQTLYYETVESLEFLNAVVQESLRLHSLTPKYIHIFTTVLTLRYKNAAIVTHLNVQWSVQVISCVYEGL